MKSAEILIAIRKIVRALNLESKRIQKVYGLSIPQLLCLGYLKEMPDCQAPVKELARQLNINPSTISGIVNRLEKKGYVARLSKREDKRVSLIALTARGLKLMEATPQLFHEKLDERLLKLPEAEIQKIEQSLKTLATLLEVEGYDASPVLALDENLADDEMNGQVQ
jgi:DNA-binding MarR family transcriptional regulator